MKKETFSPAFKKWLEDASDEIARQLLIPHYRIVFKFVPFVSGYAHMPKVEGGITFCIQIDEVYFEADVSVTKKAQDKFMRGELTYLKEDLIHELAHIVTKQFSDQVFHIGLAKLQKTKVKPFVIDFDERLTQTLTNVLKNKI